MSHAVGKIILFISKTTPQGVANWLDVILMARSTFAEHVTLLGGAKVQFYVHDFSIDLLLLKSVCPKT